MMEVRPTMEDTCMSMPPVIMTKVTKMEIIQMGRKSLAAVKTRGRERNFSFAAPNTAHSTVSKISRKRFQRKLGPFHRRRRPP